MTETPPWYECAAVKRRETALLERLHDEETASVSYRAVASKLRAVYSRETVARDLREARSRDCPGGTVIRDIDYGRPCDCAGGERMSAAIGVML
jgi:hypothetical protein